jgi:hypothetical protein
MNIHKNDLKEAEKQGLLNPGQLDAIIKFIEEKKINTPQFTASHVLYYFGGLIILMSMSWFLTKAWNDGLAIMLVSGFFGLAYLALGHYLFCFKKLEIPGGLLITAAVGLTPVFVYGLQLHLGHWPESFSYHSYHVWVKNYWLYMEIATLITGSIALMRYKFPFISFCVAFTLWYLSMDLTAVIYGNSGFNWNERYVVSLWFGLGIIILSYFIDKLFEKDFAFWTYLAGALAFWGGLSLMKSNSELSKFIFCMINVGLIFSSVYLRRKIFIILGAMGVMGYLGHLSWRVFEDSMMFSISLSLLGLAIVVLGIFYQKKQKIVHHKIDKFFPAFLQKLRPISR